MSESIRLVKNGVFPLVFDEFGVKLPYQPETGYNVAGTIQGEGKLVGIPVLFIRTSGCNLRCIWELPNGDISICDTAESSFDTRGAVDYEISRIVNLLKHNLGNISHIVISGGEPMLQHNPIIKLCKSIKEEFNSHITIETNGTVYIDELTPYVDLFSISPKLKGSTPSIEKLNSANLTAFASYIQLHENRRENLNALKSYFENRSFEGKYSYDIQLKFVVSREDEENEIYTLINQIKGVNPTDIVLMPLGAETSEISLSNLVVGKMAIRNGWRFSPRLHIDLFTNKPGV